ncbi:MAG: hypothetical protein AAFX45_13705 [Pseudomonadota bacterium]
MEFNAFTLALLVVVPIALSLGVMLLTKKRFGNVAALVIGVAVLALSAWAALNWAVAG